MFLISLAIGLDLSFGLFNEIEVIQVEAIKHTTTPPAQS